MFLLDGHAGRLESGVAELIDQRNQRHAVLQGHRVAGSDDIHKATDGAALLGHSDKQFTRLTILVQPHRQIAFMAGDREFVRNALSCFGRRRLKGRARSDFV